jgi:hypothetical protein
MSYNIDNWKTKRLDNLRFPLSALYEDPPAGPRGRGWQPDPPILADLGQEVATDDHPPQRFRFGADAESGQCCLISIGEGWIGGVLTDGMLLVEHIDLVGEGSGTLWGNLIVPALERSTGTMEAVRVWEGGDCVDRVTVRDGEVDEEEIDL